MVEIDVSLPGTFALQRVDPVPGWQESTTAGHLRFFDGNVPQGGYAQFTFSGVFATKAVVELPVITRAADGTTIDWDQAPTGSLPAAVMFPGYPDGSSPIPGVVLAGSSSGGGWGPLVVAVAALVVLAAGGYVVARRRRSLGARPGPRPGPPRGPRGVSARDGPEFPA